MTSAAVSCLLVYFSISSLIRSENSVERTSLPRVTRAASSRMLAFSASIASCDFEGFFASSTQSGVIASRRWTSSPASW